MNRYLVLLIKVQRLYNLDHQIWPIILLKALIVAFQGFENLSKASACQIFHALTGCNTISFKVKEDLSKNNQLLKFITSNEKKNFILIASKKLHSCIDERNLEQQELSNYYILSQKTVNGNLLYYIDE